MFQEIEAITLTERVSAALKNAEDALAKDGKYVQAYMLKAACLFNLNKPDELEKFFSTNALAFLDLKS